MATTASTANHRGNWFITRSRNIGRRYRSGVLAR
jgi:hypothetical protein